MKRVVVVVFCSVALLLSSTARADELPPSAFVEGVIGHPQDHNLSCESRSAADIAAFWGVGCAEDDFFRQLPKSDNPNRGFVGDVDLPPGSMPPVGYGVYVGPVAATLRSFGLNARAWRGWSLDDLKVELAAGRPAIVWATYDMRLSEVQAWTSFDGATSSIVQWQHTFIAVGYDAEGLYLVDAYDGVTKHFTYEQFTPAWEQLDKIAVTVHGPALAPGGRVWKAKIIGNQRQFVVDGRWVAGPE
ncbi:MAG: C39 family peptidase [Chloroflexota bacterium]|nr:C39 family peptidase [Chloroflexota bacterium]